MDVKIKINRDSDVWDNVTQFQAQLKTCALVPLSLISFPATQSAPPLKHLQMRVGFTKCSFFSMMPSTQG